MSCRLLNCWRRVECKRRQWCYYIIISDLVTITTWKPSLFGHCRLHLSLKYVTLRGKFKQRKVYGLIQKVADEFLFWKICRSSWILMVITKKKTIKNFPDITFVLRNFTLFHCPEACRFPLDAVNYMQLMNYLMILWMIIIMFWTIKLLVTIIYWFLVPHQTRPEPPTSPVCVTSDSDIEASVAPPQRDHAPPPAPPMQELCWPGPAVAPYDQVNVLVGQLTRQVVGGEVVPDIVTVMQRRQRKLCHSCPNTSSGHTKIR